MSKYTHQMAFHGYLDARLYDATLGVGLGEWKTNFSYTMHNHFHPFVGELLEQFNKQSIDGLLDADFHASLEAHFFKAQYRPNEDDEAVDVTYFPKQMDVGEEGPYANYNWELLFHVPLTIAVHLSKSQRFAEAQRWFHYIFDPTVNDGQYWRFLGFRQQESVKRVDALLRILSEPDDTASEETLTLKRHILSGYESLRRNPFQPHVVARTRFLAYQYCVVMKYLDNLIAWGDSLFRQDTVESLNEATQIYVLAANLLGPVPERIPRRGATQPKTFAQLRRGGLDPLGNALVELEGEFPFNLHFPRTDEVDTDQVEALFGIGRTLYFCIPQNEKLLGYWDTVADRLFKLRHCMNIEGVVRQLPLFDPPIDPGMLVKAAAAGIDVNSMVNGLNQPLAPVRSRLLIQKAQEICSEVRSLGTSLLTALEKQDAEALTRLRQQHEINIQSMVQDVRYLQWKEAEAHTEALIQSRRRAVEQYRYYQRLLGKGDDAEDGALDLVLERRTLDEENFADVYGELVDQYAQTIEHEPYGELELMADGHPASGEPGDLFLNRNEDADLNVHMPRVNTYRWSAYGLMKGAPVLGLIPQFPVNLHYWGIGTTIEFGGEQLSKAAVLSAEVLEQMAAWERHRADSASKTASFERRADEWRLQSNLAAHDLMHMGRQIIASLIREQVTRHEYDILKAQMEQAQEMDRFLQDKFTNTELYGWMQGELSKLYYEYYKLAFDIARKAEQTMKHELMRSELDETQFVKFNYWDGGRKGLLAGEALHLDLKRMELAYHDHNKREYELTKHVSLRQLDPAALLALKATGTCEVSLPEALFDLDGPGHYMRRIKSVSLSIPAVTGPYTSVNCTLSLLKSTIRRSPQLRGDEYAPASDGDDDRFIDYYGTIQSIVTSSAQDDSGMFETNLHDERFLPFEGAGVISTWRLELPDELRQFDYNTISDVIIHIRYTSRPGGDLLRQKAVEHVRSLTQAIDEAGPVRLFSLKHEFSTEWHHFLAGEVPFTARVEKSHFPFFVQGESLRITGVELYAIENGELLRAVPDGVDVEAMTAALQEERAFDLTLAPDGTVLRRSPQAYVFALVRYATSAGA